MGGDRRFQITNLGGGMVMEAIGAALGSLNAAKDLVQAFNGVQTAAAVLDVKLDLQRHLLTAYDGIAAAQQDLTTLEMTKRQLEQKIMEFEDWSAQTKKYELADAGSGSLAYRKKTTMGDMEPPHWLCPNCYEQRVKAILQPIRMAARRSEALICNRCNARLITQGFDDTPPRIPSMARR